MKAWDPELPRKGINALCVSKPMQQTGTAPSLRRRVWLIKEGEPLPTQAGARLMRTGLLARELANQGHDVTWWTSAYSHAEKRRIDEGTDAEPVSDGVRLMLLKPTVTYRRNVSIARLAYHRSLGAQFLGATRAEEVPDLIVCAYPSIDLAFQAVRYGLSHGIPVILDVRDHWPDIFLRGVPRWAAWAARPILWPQNRRARWALKNATGLVAITPSALKWAQEKARITPSSATHCVVPLGAERPVLSEPERSEANAFWRRQGITDDTWNVCFFGTLSNSSMDLDTAIAAIHRIFSDRGDIRLVLCGTGDAEEALRDQADWRCIVMPGWVNAPQIRALMAMSKVGLYPIRNLPDFRDTISNKFIEYLSGGLPVLTSLQGSARRYLEDFRVGLPYDEGSPASLELALKALMSDEDLRIGMTKRALTRFETDFNVEVTNRALIDHIFSFVLDQGRPHGRVG